MIEAAEAYATHQHDAPSVSAKPRLLDQMRQVIRVKHYSMRTEKTYLSWVKQFIRWSGMRHPTDMGAPEIESFLSMLANQRDVAASTQNQALAALLFLYKQVLGIDLPWLDGITRAKKPARLPVVLSQAEVSAVLGNTSGVTDARLEARELVRASFTRITLWLAGNPASPGGGFLDMEITARSGGVQRLRVDRASGRLLG